ncbi:MAG: DUF3604 domain-containing protein [Stagnimonas sp.]|nr:DUF3604 domain-containing protein [Stagnimonas sp.]
MSRRTPCWPALALALGLTACGRSQPPTTPLPPPPVGGIDGARCGDYSETRNAYFGDLHIHTANSFDAYLFGNHMNDPAVAYDFAQGRRIQLNDNAAGPRSVQLQQPLDFAAVTDHSEYIGEVNLCTNPDQSSLAYQDPLCQQFRTADPNDALGFLIWGLRLTKPSYGRQHFCLYADCTASAQNVWEESARITDSRNQACRFTTFNAYEYSPSSDGARLHRNILFRGREVPTVPVSYFDAPEAQQLFQQLDAACRPEDGCEYLSIPHNSNLSHGRLLWADPERFGDPDYVAGLRQIAQVNPVLEVMQIKGSSECKLGLGTSTTDEECEFEQVRAKPLCCDSANGITENCVQALPSVPFQGEPNCHEVCPGDRPKASQNEPDNSQGCVASHDFVRGAFLKGMAAQKQLGFNPLRFGMIASTDNHNAASGDVAEAGNPGSALGWEGAHGGQDDDPAERLDVLTNIGRITNPGGLAGVWAEENTRDALFRALKRGEVFATSGTRLRLRLFAGDYPADLCSRPDAELQRLAYERGVPMGGDLRPPGAGAAPQFLLQALADRHPLQRSQIVKLWVDAAGQGHEKVFELQRHGDPASVDEACGVHFRSPPETRMSSCLQWQDPEFDAGQPASYYARVFEDASCRWTGHLCAALQQRGALDCAATPDHACCSSSADAVTKVIQERAWSSPIWYQPAAAP